MANFKVNSSWTQKVNILNMKDMGMGKTFIILVKERAFQE